MRPDVGVRPGVLGDPRRHVHLGRSSASRKLRLAALLEEAQIAGHSFITGEVAMRTLSRRTEILELLGNLPQIPLAEHDEVLRFVEKNELDGTGLGWVDAHLLAAAALDRSRL